MSGKTGSIPRAFIESLLSRADVVQVINQRVPLKKAGTSYKACCPFHDEKSPSFNVSSAKQFYHCFGCGASGDALKFLMEYDGLSFVEAVESLAAQYGLEVPREQLSPKQQVQQQAKQQQQRDLYEVMHLVAKFYRHQLRDHATSKHAKQYLKARGLSPEIAKTFVIGFAPEGWDTLVMGLKADTKLKKQLIEVGMLVEKDGGKIYDRFRHRIMFPIRDGRGRVVAFGGRVLGDDQPKYLNSPETPIFHKSYALYGLYEMRQTRQKFENILVVEGYMDVVALAQFGVCNAVATLGTATTEHHLTMLFRQVNEIVFCFDGDQAGLKAAWKAMALSLPLMENERSVKFLFLEQGEDPDSTIRKEGLSGFNQRIKQALALSEFMLQGVQTKLSFPLSSIEGRQQMVSLIQPYVHLAHGLYQYLLVEGLADAVGLPAWRLEKQLNVHSGFASFKKDTVKNAVAKSNSGSVSKVASLPLKLVRILLRRPHWSQYFPGNFAQGLIAMADRDYQTLGIVIQNIVQNGFHADNVAEALSFNGFADELNVIGQTVLPDDDGFLRAEFDVAIVNLAVAMNEQALGKSGWDLNEMIKLQSLAGER